MPLTVEQNGPAHIVRATGRLDQTTSNEFQIELEKTIDDLSRPLILLDFSGVDYISSIGLRALLMAAKQCKAKNGSLVMANLTDIVQEVFDIARFDKIIPVQRDESAAMNYLLSLE